MSVDKTRRLGRGLEALLSVKPQSTESARAGDSRVDDVPKLGLRQIPLSQIRPNPLQPRKEFDPAELADLESSIRTNGLLQPVTVRVAANGFELIAGERRFRAVQRVGWSEIPAIVRGEDDVDDRTALTLALVENLQRADLNPIEEAEGYQQLIAQFSLTQQEVADVVGKDRSTVANTLRMLALPAGVRRMVREGQLTLGHARALLALGDDHRMLELAKTVVTDGLSVREVERRVRESGTGRTRPAAPASSTAEAKRPPEVTRIEDELRRRLQTDVRINLNGKDKGEIRISFYSADDLERVLDVMLGDGRERL
ncbi:MAG: ParB/RepB/Spo0J family partition protein [Gemmatimonadetes bacterium]|nr:ParB/RepB/Spo0J family partition protein [Gemmatimonadota bacterium]MBI3504573.1 ParB/RepB/Spo0J family partition protein [Pseudomonadota bacterium]